MPSRAVLQRQVAGHLDFRRLGHAVGADHAVRRLTDVGGNQHDPAVPPASHFGNHQPAEPDAGRDVTAPDPLQGAVGSVEQGAEMRVHAHVGDQDVDGAESRAGARHQVLHLVLVVDVAGRGNGGSLAEAQVEFLGGLLAGIRLAAGCGYACAMFRHPRGDGLAYAPRGAGDQRRAALQVEQFVHAGVLSRKQLACQAPSEISMNSCCATQAGFSWPSISMDFSSRMTTRPALSPEPR